MEIEKYRYLAMELEALFEAERKSAIQEVKKMLDECRKGLLTDKQVQILLTKLSKQEEKDK